MLYCHLCWLLRLPPANICYSMPKELLRILQEPKGSVRALTSQEQPSANVWWEVVDNYRSSLALWVIWGCSETDSFTPLPGASRRNKLQLPTLAAGLEDTPSIGCLSCSTSPLPTWCSLHLPNKLLAHESLL